MFLAAFNEDEASVMRIGMDGRLRWQRDVDALLFSGPLLVGSTVVVTTDDGRLLTLDAATGDETSTREMGFEVSGPGLVVENVAYLAVWDGRILTVDAIGDFHEFPVGGNPHAVRAVVGDVAIYLDDRGMAALDVGTGRVVWREESESGFGDGVVVEGSLVVPGVPRGIRSIDARSGDFEWQFFGRSADLGLVRNAAPFVVATVAVGRQGAQADEHLLAAIDPANQESLAWDVTLPGRPATMQIHRGVILVGGRSGVDDAGRIDAPQAGWLHAYEVQSGVRLWELVTRDPPAAMAIDPDALFLLTADQPVFCD